MTAIRRLFAQRHMTVLLCAAALLLKLLIPADYMIGQVDGRAAIILCPGTTPAPGGKAMPAMAHDGDMAMGHAEMHHDPSGHGSDHSDKRHGQEMPCAFSGLTAPGLAAVDPIQLALLIVFVMAVGLAAAPPRPLLSTPHLRPPLRGPPALS